MIELKKPGKDFSNQPKQSLLDIDLSQSEFGETKLNFTSGKASQIGDAESMSPIEKLKKKEKIGVNSSMYCEVERIEKFKDLLEKITKERT